jgi:hypothetical protein
VTPAELAHAACLVLNERRRRAEIFGPAQDGFGEPAWEMLLHLVVDEATRPAMPRTELIDMAEVEGETCRIYLIWMGYRYLARHDEQTDCVQLTDRGREQMAAYLESVRVAA